MNKEMKNHERTRNNHRWHPKIILDKQDLLCYAFM